jgi:trimeric autotransporter adhesin
MKKYFSTIMLLLLLKSIVAQNVGIGTATPNSNAMLEIKSNDKGLLIPRTSTVTRVSIPSVKGLLIYDTTTNSFWHHTGIAWNEVLNSFSGWNTNGNTGTNPSINFIGTSDDNDFIFRRNNTRAGQKFSNHRIRQYGYWEFCTFF